MGEIFPNGIDLVSQLPEELIMKIFSYLELKDFENVDQVNKAFNCLAKDKTLDFSKLKKHVSDGLSIIGKGTWTRCIGDVGNTPKFPKAVIPLLESISKVQDYILVLKPKNVDGNPLTLNLIGDLVKNPKGGGYATQYKFIGNKIKTKLGDEPSKESYWFLMGKDVLPGSKGATGEEKQTMVSSIEGFRAPKLLEAVTSCFMQYVKAKEKILSLDGNSTDYTCCLDEEEGRGKLIVGGYLNSGLNVFCHYVDRSSGVVPLKKF